MKVASYRLYSGPGGNYLFYLKFEGRPYSKVVKTKAEGVRWREDKKERLKKESAQSQNTMFSMISSRYLEYCDENMCRNTVREKFRHMKALASYMGKDFDVMGLKQNECRSFLLWIKAKKGGKHANRVLRNMRACWNFHVEIIPVNIWNRVDRFPESQVIPYFPTSEEYRAVRKLADDNEGAFLDVIAMTGARRGEVIGLRWADLDFERRVITLYTRKRKGGDKSPRPAFMTDGLYAVLQNLKRDGCSADDTVFINPITGASLSPNHHFVRLMLKRLCKKAGVREFGFHSLRRFMAHNLMKSGKASLSDIQRYLGHCRATTTDLYLRSTNPSWSHLNGIIDRYGPNQEQS